MNREQIIRMAREAGFEVYGTDVWITDGWWLEELERFASLVAAAEREECAKACEELLTIINSGDEHMDGVTDCIVAIRARGEK